MEDLDLPQMKREVESLQYQLAINREKSSITVTELVKWIEGCGLTGCLCSLGRLVKWIEGCVCDDPFLNPELMRANPWVEKGKCVIL
ncbi:guanine nucleotide-binding protein G(I)/G(S)/G(O) subunit gamma-13-like isoform X1 [Oncorhynchus kisutch]|uniref:guanine nucleotide-binding protein G(I)/G(S)/G(O) subunit gamma-13-like isoform X1 n=1 Tax=Oncorhynchus kisutch TaxID=8019 RepID=UPI0012DC5D25|nr:guanine nucleotide-binding protein G(I)/G(S)/G(O) subunit gamma-13-like isoform X1 [Oncorhynchus kisutch]XP_031667037.1 guanine nucleotide-binding protein G(I)/G(S)/G(O) subunit gamma-13-like isoform X1 [Oncorhynchus kisutch]